MDRLKVFVASGVFLGLTLIKIFIPGAAQEIRMGAEKIVGHDTDYAQVFAYVSEKISMADDKSPYLRNENEKKQEAMHEPVSAANIYAAKPQYLMAEHAEVRGEATSVQRVPLAVSKFLESQEEFSEYGLPENVSYDYDELPFDCAVPVAGYESSGFGYRMHPIHGTIKFHYGTDIAANTGESICAFASGTVTFSGYSESYGNYITIDHGDGWESLYAHCSSLLVNCGESVAAGETIALVGATGQVTGPHLHFELTLNDIYKNPEYYVN